MLAKEIKIANMRKQQEYIERGLKKLLENEDGSSSFPYIGPIFPEVRAHFEGEGLTVREVHSDLLLALTRGRPIYVFSACDIELSKDELNEADNYRPEPKFEEDLDSAVRVFSMGGPMGGSMDPTDFLIKILGGRGPF